jgi:uncharacterized protein (TIGR03437 family)
MPILYAGGAPGLVGGVFQINAQIPQGLGPGEAALYLQAAGVVSPIVKISVAP